MWEVLYDVVNQIYTGLLEEVFSLYTGYYCCVTGKASVNVLSVCLFLFCSIKISSSKISVLFIMKDMWLSTA